MADMTPKYRHIGFLRSRRVTRALATGAVALTGVLALVAAHANPGRKTTTTGSLRTSPATTLDPFANGDPNLAPPVSDPNLAPPESAPSAAPAQAQPPPVVSGGS
jgi:hypothetical protein